MSRFRILCMLPLLLLPLGLYGCDDDPSEPESSSDYDWIYWAESASGQIRRCRLNGENLENVFAAPHPSGLCIDRVNERMYWTDYSTDSISSADLDGGNAIDVVTSGTSALHALDLDPVGGRIYYGRFVVQRANLDGSNVEVVHDGDFQFFGIAVDPEGGKVYWTNSGGSIQRADLDGSNVETVLGGLSGPNEIELDLSGGKMYWTSTEGGVHRANLDGTGAEQLLGTGDGVLDNRGLVLDLSMGHLYFTDIDVDGIYRADLDGSNLTQLVSGGNSARKMFLY